MKTQLLQHVNNEIDDLDPHRERLAVKVSEVRRVPKARLVYLVLLVPSAPPATMALPALTGSLDLLAFLAAPETKVPRDPPANRAVLAQLVCL